MPDTTRFDPVTRRWLMDMGPHARHVDAYRHHLFQLGHTCLTVEGYIQAARHYCHWLHLTGRCPDDAVESDVARFGAHECRCPGARRRPPGKRYLYGVRRFVRFLAGSGVTDAPAEEKPERAPEVAAWLDWLGRHKGLAASSLRRYECALSQLLLLIGTDPARYDAANLRAAFSHGGLSGKLPSRKSRATALRSWLGYNAALGRCPAILARAVPSVVMPRRDNVPRGLKAAEVERLLASCDTGTAIGRRDLAFLLLVARLGLRAGDAGGLTFEQIDWRRGRLRVTGKGRREATLPLPQEVGDAILAWLEDGRPPLDDPHVFLCMRPPWRPFSSSGVVGSIVASALRRAGLEDAPSGGVNLLRHSVACRLLEDGATLETIATLLRHKSILTTSIYARTNPIRLREIAQPWPGGAS